MPIGGQIIIVVTVTLAVFMLIYELFKIKKIKRERTEEFCDKLSGEHILYKESMANFFGIHSEGMMQVRGNGFFAITEKSIYFSLLIPRKDIVIPIEQIESIGEGKSFLGKSKFRPLLIINYTNENNEPEQAAWLLKDLEQATTILNESITKKE